jgi:hypothetical protein
MFKRRINKFSLLIVEKSSRFFLNGSNFNLSYKLIRFSMSIMTGMRYEIINKRIVRF